jgi:hypothetical protein
MYRRLAVIDIQLEELGLTHRKNQAMLLRRLANNQDISALQTLVSVIEPVKEYRRYPAPANDAFAADGIDRRGASRRAERAKINNFTRRDFLKFAAVGTIGLTFADSIFGQASSEKKQKKCWFTSELYTSGKSRSEGIYIYKLNLDSGELKPYKTVKNVVEPSFLAIDKNKKYLYAVNETVEYEGKKSGAVSAFAIDQKTGDLRFLNKQPSLGGAPCHVTRFAKRKIRSGRQLRRRQRLGFSGSNGRRAAGSARRLIWFSTRGPVRTKIGRKRRTRIR